MHPDHRRASHNGDHLLGFVGTALIPSLSPSQNEFPIPEHQNIIRLDEHLRITHMDDKYVVDLHRFSLSLFVTVSHRLQRTLNWNLAYMTSSLYLYVHPDDLSSLIAAHRDCKCAAVKNRSLRRTVHGSSPRHRLLVPSRQQLVLNVVRLQTNVIAASAPQHQRKSNGTTNPAIVEQKWVWCDLLATMMQSKTNDENFVILVVEIIG